MNKLEDSFRKERRTLVVCYDPAFHPFSGADLRNHRNAVSAAAFGPVCLASIRAQSDRPILAANIQTAALTIDGEPRARSLGWWRTIGENRIPGTALSRLKALVRTFQPDTIVVEGIPLFRLLRPLRPLARQLVLDMHNVESDLAGQFRSASSIASQSPTVAAAAGLKRLESKALAIVDRVWVCSKQDRERLTAFYRPRVPIDVVPNGIPRFEDIPTDLPAQTALPEIFPVILFIGHLGYEPNIDAVERLAGNILPRIRQALPSAKLILAGRSPAPVVKALTRLQGVELVDDPEDVTPLLSRAHLTIVPLSTGGGTRIKILEAMAWGIPVIATPVAAEGLDLVDNEEVILSDSEERLAESAIELCLDRTRMARQRIRAHEAVWSRFGPEAIHNAVRCGLGLEEVETTSWPTTRSMSCR